MANVGDRRSRVQPTPTKTTDPRSQGRDRAETTPEAPLDPLSDPLRAAIRADPRSSYAIARMSRVDPNSMRQFVSGKRDLKLAIAGPIADELGLRLEPVSEAGGQSLDGQLRAAIRADPRSIFAIARMSRVHRGNVSQFVSGKADMMLANAGAIAGVLGLAFVSGDPRATVVPLDPLSDPLRAAIRADGRTNNAIATAARVHASSVRQFVSGKADLTLTIAGPIADELGLRLEPVSEAGGQSLDGQLRAAIRADGRTNNAIARAACISSSSVHQFVSGKADLTLTIAGPIAGVLGLAFVSGDPRATVVPLDPLSDPLRAAIRADPRSSYAIARMSRVHPSSVSQFVSGKRDLTLANAGPIADELGLRLEPVSEAGGQSLDGQLRAAIRADGRTNNAIARAACISVRQFVSGKKDMMLANAGAIAGVLGLAFVSGDPTQTRKDGRTTTPDRRCPIELRGEGFPIIVHEGDRKLELPKMSGVAYLALKFVVDAFPGGGYTPGELSGKTESARAMRLFGQALRRDGFEPLRRMIPSWNAGRGKVIEIVDAGPRDDMD